MRLFPKGKGINGFPIDGTVAEKMRNQIQLTKEVRKAIGN